MPSAPRTPLSLWGARGALIAAPLLMGVALVLSGWTTFAGVRDATRALGDAQADAVGRSIRGALLELGRVPTDDDLGELVSTLEDDGLRYVALLGPGGEVVAHGGVASADPERVRTTLRPGRGRSPRWARHEQRLELRVELEPTRAGALRTTAARTFGLGAATAGVLLVGAVVLVRSALRSQALARQLERDRGLAQLGQMSAVLAHEIKNPLASLKGNAQLLAGSLPEGEKPRAKAERLVAEAVRLEHLTADLLAFARTGDLHRAEVSPAALVTQVAAEVSPAIQVDASRAPARFALDEARVRQLLINVLTNAVQAGGPVTVSAGAEHGALVLEVTDRGPGVPVDERARIFEAFHTTRTQGTGLGLAIAARAAQLHGGSITVDDAPGGGARFRVRLPGAG